MPTSRVSTRAVEGGQQRPGVDEDRRDLDLQVSSNSPRTNTVFSLRTGSDVRPT
jgi:hypothetical protein